MQVGIQPFTIRAIDESTAENVARVARAGFDGIELGPDENTRAVRNALDEHDLSVSSMGSGLDALEDDDGLEDHLDASEAFGTDDVVVMWIDPEHFETREAVEETAHQLSEWAGELADHGLQLHYHNHAHEFAALGDTNGYEVLVEESDGVHFELDLGWAGTGGADPAGLLEEIGDRVSLVHVKDMGFDTEADPRAVPAAEGEFTTFGTGDLDIEDCVATAHEAGAEWVIFENDEPVDPVAEPGHASTVLDEYTDHYC